MSLLPMWVVCLVSLFYGSCEAFLIDHYNPKLNDVPEVIKSSGESSTYSVWSSSSRRSRELRVERQVHPVRTACRNLTIDDVSINGGAVCHWYHAAESQLCYMKCNRGYGFRHISNQREFCGPSTGFIWTFEHRHERVQDCEEEFFPAVLKGEAMYYVKDCDQLSSKAQDDAKKQFVNLLMDRNICRQTVDANLVTYCNIMVTKLACGKEVRKAAGLMNEVKLSFTAPVLIGGEKLESFPSTSCHKFCSLLHLDSHICGHSCIRALTTYLTAAARQIETNIKNIFQQDMSFTASSVFFECASADRHSLDQSPYCLSGSRINNKSCEPCVAGTFYDKRSNFCVPCPPGWYSDQPRQNMCWPCPDGLTTWVRGSTSCKYK